MNYHSNIRALSGLLTYAQKSNLNFSMPATSDIVQISAVFMDLLHLISIPFTLAIAKKHTVDQFKTVQKPRRIAVLICIAILLILKSMSVLVCKLITN